MPTTKPKPASPFGPNILPAQSTTSHWQRSTAGNAFATCGMNDALPADADVVIIGSGLSGESRRTFQSTDNRRGDRPQPAVLSQPPGLGGHSRSPRGVLWRLGKERRALSPGRLPRLHLVFPVARPRASQEDPRVRGNHIEQVGLGSGGEAVADVRVAAFVDKHNIECELVLRPTMDVCLTDSFEEYETKAFGQAKAGGIDLSGVKHLSKDVTAKVGPEFHQFEAYLSGMPGAGRRRRLAVVSVVCQPLETRVRRIPRMLRPGRVWSVRICASHRGCAQRHLLTPVDRRHSPWQRQRRQGGPCHERIQQASPPGA